MPPIYQPPYDSPIEDEFARRYVKYAASDAVMTPQVAIKTICGAFVMDFFLSTASGYRVGIECDGKEYHEASRDEWRDAMILGSHGLDAIYRIRGSDIVHNLDDVLYLLSTLESPFFDPRATSNLEVLARQEARDLDKDLDSDSYRIVYKSEDMEVMGSLHVEARRHRIPLGQRRFWQAAYQHAQSAGGGRLDDVIAAYRSQGSGGIRVDGAGQ